MDGLNFSRHECTLSCCPPPSQYFLDTDFTIFCILNNNKTFVLLHWFPNFSREGERQGDINCLHFATEVALRSWDLKVDWRCGRAAPKERTDLKVKTMRLWSEGLKTSPEKMRSWILHFLYWRVRVRGWKVLKMLSTLGLKTHTHTHLGRPNICTTPGLLQQKKKNNCTVNFV